jgi:hypothetical protein
MAASSSVTLRKSVTDGRRLGRIGNWVPGHGVHFTLPTRGHRARPGVRGGCAACPPLGYGEARCGRRRDLTRRSGRFRRPRPPWSAHPRPAAGKQQPRNLAHWACGSPEDDGRYGRVSTAAGERVRGDSFSAAARSVRLKASTREGSQLMECPPGRHPRRHGHLDAYRGLEALSGSAREVPAGARPSGRLAAFPRAHGVSRAR